MRSVRSVRLGVLKPRGFRLAHACGLVTLLVGLISSCSREAATESASAQQDTLQPAEMTRLKAAHSMADAARTDRERDAAISALRAELPEVSPAAGVGLVWLFQDLSSRISSLELQQGRPDEALRAAEAGLSVSKTASVPLSNLYIARARVFERLAKKNEAAEAYYQALLVNEQLMRDALEDE